ncbi:leukotriene A-4 hydrolase-like [Temnothorax nylanderi]|uniref:leukotriene A-4 hydrolase-like n=1 Tax=Temnothorax nylanderi TaxID=102681 RepID=UPI003A8955CB
MMHGSEKRDEADDQDIYYFSALNIKMAPYKIYIIVCSLRSLHKSREGVSLDLWAEEKSCQRRTEFLDKIVDILYNIKESHGFLMGILSEVNVFVLPPNVPEFDMQYPYMTFVSSSLLEGQYSIIDKIVQNIIESWIGRTVTIDNFKHLWLIKGLSTFIYRNRINDKIIDKEMKFRTDLEIKGINNLLSMPELQTDSLVPDLTGKLPMNIIKYVSEKGCAFLNHLQDMLGGPEEFKSFLVNCLLPRWSKHREIPTTDRFKEALNTYFFLIEEKRGTLNSIEWDKWFNEPDFPTQSYSTTLRKTYWQVQADLWIAQKIEWFDEKLERSNDLDIIEILTYLLAMPNTELIRKLSEDKLRRIEHEFLRDQEICEIRFLWLRLCIKSKWLDDGRIQEEALKFACEYCMPKYACPIFRDLYEWEVTRKLARSWFMDPDNRSKMLPETIKELESILEI